MKTYRFGLVALVLGAVAALELPAQVRPTPRRAAAPQGAPAQQQQPRAVGRDGGPAGMILSRGAQLNLTDDQVKKLQALQEGQKDARPSETAMMRLRADLMDANKGEGNLEAARTALDKISKVRNDEVIARMKSRKDARDVLTAAQRAQLDRMGGGMRQGGMRQGGMRMRQRLQMRQRMQGMRGRGMVGPGMGGRGMGGPGMGGGRGMGGPGMGGGRGGAGMGGTMRFRRMPPGMGQGGAGFGMPGMRGNGMGPGDMGPGDMGPGSMNPDAMPMGARRFKRQMDGAVDGPNGPPRATRVPLSRDNPPAALPPKKPPTDSVPPTER